MVATLTNPDLPTLSPEDGALLLRYFAANENLQALAAELASQATTASPARPSSGPSTEDAEPPSQHSARSTPHSPPSFLTLLIWTASPTIAPYIALYRTHQSHLDRRDAIDALKLVLRTSQDPIEKRRAASSMLRLLENPNRRAASQAPGPRPERLSPQHSAPSTQHHPLDPDDSLIDQSDDEDASEDLGLRTKDSGPPPPPDPFAPLHPKHHFPITPIVEAFADKPGQIDSVPHGPLPDPCREPADVALLALNAIKAPDQPADGAGPRILFNLSGHLRDRSPAAFDNFHNNYLRNCLNRAWSFRSFEFTQTRIEPQFASFTALLTEADGQTCPLQITLEKLLRGTLQGCWVIKHLWNDFSKRSPNSS